MYKSVCNNVGAGYIIFMSTIYNGSVFRNQLSRWSSPVYYIYREGCVYHIFYTFFTYKYMKDFFFKYNYSKVFTLNCFLFVSVYVSVKFTRSVMQYIQVTS